MLFAFLELAVLRGLDRASSRVQSLGDFVTESSRCRRLHGLRATTATIEAFCGVYARSDSTSDFSSFPLVG